MRECAGCLALAVDRDPWNIFRSVGGEEMEVPGGTHSFVSGVMQEIHLRQTERKIVPSHRPMLYRWAAAASLFLALAGSQAIRVSNVNPVAGIRLPEQSVAAKVAMRQMISRPVVEEYGSSGATIVEVPTEDTGDLKVVMVFDDSLPVDL